MDKTECEFCNDTKIMPVSNGPDDYEDQPCPHCENKQLEDNLNQND